MHVFRLFFQARAHVCKRLQNTRKNSSASQNRISTQRTNTALHTPPNPNLCQSFKFPRTKTEVNKMNCRARGGRGDIPRVREIISIPIYFCGRRSCNKVLHKSGIPPGGGTGKSIFSTFFSKSLIVLHLARDGIFCAFCC